MWTPNLHLYYRNAPHRGIAIELFPVRVPQLARPDKNVGGETQRSACRWPPVKAVDSTQQRAERYGINDAGAVPG
ncbi:MAG: hypothetical protein JO283_07415 [Bradyrhizobium sp.]|nr:hypothetical protein [Bradyrhizobium sp.]